MAIDPNASSITVAGTKTEGAFADHSPPIANLAVSSPSATVHNQRSRPTVRHPACPNSPRKRKAANFLSRSRTDDGTLFLGDGSLAGAPAPKLNQRGIRSVIKVVDERSLYVQRMAKRWDFEGLLT
jgi:hypothetical protein